MKEKPSWSFSSQFNKPRHRRSTYLIGWSSQTLSLLTHGLFLTLSTHQNRDRTWGSQPEKPRLPLGELKAPSIKKWHTPEQVWYIFLSAEGSGIHSWAIHHAAKIRSCLEGMIYYWLHNKDSYISHEKQKGEIYLGIGQIYPWYEKWIH